MKKHIEFKRNNYIYSKSSTFKKFNEKEKIMTSQGIKSSNYSRDVIKIYIDKFRSVLGDGDCFYRGFMF